MQIDKKMIQKNPEYTETKNWNVIEMENIRKQMNRLGEYMRSDNFSRLWTSKQNLLKLKMSILQSLYDVIQAIEEAFQKKNASSSN